MSSEKSIGSSRDYKCPCGKTYLSYPAIFTHIKLKHGGKAPGKIEKPTNKNRPRGRPPMISKKEMTSEEKTTEAKKEGENGINIQLEKNQNSKYFQAFRQIFNHLREIEHQGYLEKDLWEDVQAFNKFDRFVTDRNINSHQQYVSIGLGLSQFLNSVSNETGSEKFQQVFIIFMLLLQYVMDENNDAEIISKAPVQFLIEYMNPFINYFIEDEAERLQLRFLWIMKKENVTKIFLAFYNWLKWKKYTGFCITLIGFE